MENEQTGLFDNMSNKQVEDLAKIGELIFGAVDKAKASDEKFKNDLNEELKKIDNSRDLRIYTNGLEKGKHEGKKEGFWKGVATGTVAGTVAGTVGITGLIGLGYYLYSKNKKS